jgi:hypothetical protein
MPDKDIPTTRPILNDFLQYLVERADPQWG